jgi:hypothetical protein
MLQIISDDSRTTARKRARTVQQYYFWPKLDLNVSYQMLPSRRKMLHFRVEHVGGNSTTIGWSGTTILHHGIAAIIENGTVMLWYQKWYLDFPEGNPKVPRTYIIKFYVL